MPELTNKIVGGLIGLAFTALTGFTSWLCFSVAKHNEIIINLEGKIKTTEDKVNEMNKDFDKLGDVYVTRREFTVIADNLNTTLKRVDDNILKLTEKFYENQGKK